jgi:hypothetical protein
MMLASQIRLNNTCTEKHEGTLGPKLSQEAPMWLLKANTHIQVGIQVSENQVQEVVPLTIDKSFISAAHLGPIDCSLSLQKYQSHG